MSGVRLKFATAAFLAVGAPSNVVVDRLLLLSSGSVRGICASSLDDEGEYVGDGIEAVFVQLPFVQFASECRYKHTS